MAKAFTPEAASKRPATFWKDEAEEWGLTAKMLKCICSATQGERALAFHEAQKAKPDARGARRHWKRFEQIGQGRRLGTPRKGDTSILKTKPNRFALFWDRIKVWGKRQESNATEYNGSDAADQFVEELEQAIWCLEVKKPETTEEDDRALKVLQAKREKTSKSSTTSKPSWPRRSSSCRSWSEPLGT